MFTIIYLLGMLFMIVATLAFPSLQYLNLTTLPYLKVSVIISPFLHIGMFVKAHQLLFSLTHLLALVVASFTDDDLEYAGATIRTAGYLYTLLGLTAALLYLNAEENKAAYHLASAAGTSLISGIIGYCLGNAIESKNRPSRRDSMRKLQEIKQTLRHSCDSEERAMQEINKTLQDSCASEKLAMQEINQTLQYSSSSKELAKAHNAYIDKLVDIMEEAAAAIQNATQKINNTMDRYNRTQLDILTNLENATKQIAELSEQLARSRSNSDSFSDMPLIDLSGSRREPEKINFL